MAFDNEQIGQLRQILREEVPVIVTPIVTQIVADAEERIVSRITFSVGEMIEDNILPQFGELRTELKADIDAARAELKADIADLQRDMTEVKYDLGNLKRDMTGLRSGRWQLAA